MTEENIKNQLSPSREHVEHITFGDGKVPRGELVELHKVLFWRQAAKCSHKQLQYATFYNLNLLVVITCPATAWQGLKVCCLNLPKLSVDAFAELNSARFWPLESESSVAKNRTWHPKKKYNRGPSDKHQAALESFKNMT